MRTIIALVLFLWSTTLQAQQGNYFLTHYAPDDKQFDNVCFDLAQDKRGLIHLATRAGVLEFDGRSWDLANDVGAVYTLAAAPSGNIFWAGETGYGILGNEKIDFENKRLSTPQTRDVFRSLTINDHAYFLNNKTLFVYSEASQKTIEIKYGNPADSFSGLFELYGKVYINTEQGQVLTLAGNTLKPATLNISKGEEIVFCEGYENDYLIGTAEGHLYQCANDLNCRQITLSDREYAEASVIVSGVRVNKYLVALGTLRGGVMFVNVATGKTEEIINYNTGLPDNEVFALLCDQNKNVWVAHDYGFTCIAPYIPLRSFNYYNGLNGNLLCAISFHDQVYVGTSLGLFKLEKQELYDEITYYVAVKVKKSVKPEKSTGRAAKAPQGVAEPEPEQEAKKRGFFSFLKRNKNKAKDAEKHKPEEHKHPDKQITNEAKTPNYVKEKRVKRILRSSSFSYTKIKGVDAKVTQLVEVKGKLLAAGLAGVHEINDLGAKPLLEEPVRYIYASKDFLLVSTDDDKIKSWVLNDPVWTPTNVLDDIDDNINFIFEGNENELWLCSGVKVYRAQLVDKKIDNILTVDYASTNFDKTVGTHWNGHTVLANEEGFFSYEAKKNRFIKIDSLPTPTSFFAWKNTIWYHAVHGWKSLGTGADQSNLRLLNLFDDLRFITSNQQGDAFWLVTRNNQLFKFFGGRLHAQDSRYPLILKSISKGKTDILYRSEVKAKIKVLDQPGALTIQVVKPDYIGSQSLEYRYYVEGLQSEWSDWSTANNRVDFPFLPPGKYDLSVEARDIFGDVKTLGPLAFVVQPPYWQRLWFYALEFAGFALLVLLSFKLSSRYIIISRILSLLTIILLIQLMQTGINSYVYTKTSPVIDFFVQVVVALFILPVEGYLRKLMFQSHSSTESLQQLLLLKLKNKKSQG